jgi:general L-amino acid transport system permease protein
MSMSGDMNTIGIGFVRTEQAPTLSPPASTVGVIGWVRANLFAGPVNTLLTVVGVYIIYLIVPPLWNFFIANAVTEGKV